jgi:ribosomal protein S1/(E)-4-hydroxy-3-methyl-but-2-enyl pyrophosphate reductase
LKIILAEHLGTCFGVKKALEAAERFADSNMNVYTLGPLIHNKQVVERLGKKGIRVIDTLDSIEGGTVIIRSHGIPPEIHGQAAGKVVELVDATCPFVRKIQEKVKEYYGKGYQIIIIGDVEHPEVKGVNGWCNYNAIILDKPEDAERIGNFEKLCVVAQTTITKELWEEMKSVLEKKGGEVKFFNTICSATSKRQQAAVELAGKVDIMLVIGGLHSSNTQKLYKLCKEICKNIYHIETADDLPLENIKGAESIGITAGASTPDWIIKEVIDKMTEMDKMKQQETNEQTSEEQMLKQAQDVEETTGSVEGNGPEETAVEGAATEDAAVEGAATEGEAVEEASAEGAAVEEASAEGAAVEEASAEGAAVEEASTEDAAVEEVSTEEKPLEEETPEKDTTMKEIEDTMVTVRVGKVVKGQVIQVGENDVIVNIGYKADGVIPRDELSNDPTLKPSDIVTEGEEIEVFVKRIDEKEGSVLLSKKKVDIEKAWKALKEKQQTGEPVNVKVLEEVKGGLIAIAEGIRGFIPASHIDIGYVEVLQDFVGQELPMKVIEFNRSKGKVIFSRKALLEEQKEKKKKEILESLKAGDRIEGEVKRITDFGAFVDVGGIDGLVHISEMSWSRIDHPSEVLETGQRVEVEVLGVEPENERISLSLKRTKPHPWDNIQERYKAGDVVTGKVVRLVDFGAFVELEPGVEGLVHVSQIAYTHVEKPQDVLEEGQMVEVKVLDVKPDERRISLSIKETTEKPRREFNKEKAQAQQVHSEDHPPITIGELVGDIFKEDE